jgi:predicted PurR-regulated permease PerM
MNSKLSQTIGFFTLFAAAIIVVIAMIWPFWHVIALAGILTIIFLPVHRIFLHKLKNDSFAAITTVALVLLIVIIPLYFVISIATQEAISFYGQYQNGTIQFDSNIITSHLPAAWQETATNTLNAGLAKLGDGIRTYSLDISGAISDIAGFIVSIFLFILTLFFFLRDEKKIAGYMNDLFPLPTDQKGVLLKKTEAAINGVVRGSFLTALIQGAAATIGFLLAGLPQAFFLGIATVFAAFVPMVGIGLVMVPTILYLLIFKSFTSAMILIAWFIVPATIDNIVSPYLIGSRTKIHPLAVLFSALGGIALFGTLGFLFGPILMAIAIAFIDVYRNEYRKAPSARSLTIEN